MNIRTQPVMALAHRTRQSGDAATRWPITVLLSNGAIRKQDSGRVQVGKAASLLAKRLNMIGSCL